MAISKLNSAVSTGACANGKPVPVDATGNLERVETNQEPVPVEGDENPCRNERRPHTNGARPKMRVYCGMFPMEEECAESCGVNASRTRNVIGR